jgi:protein transport protein SEC24
MICFIGNCNLRFFRITTYNIPNSENLLNTSHIPMGLVIQPLAKLCADEVCDAKTGIVG